MKIESIFAACIASLLISCNAGNKNNVSETIQTDTQTIVSELKFNTDSAYKYIEQQVAFGPRVPNTSPHLQCANWLSAELQRHGATVSCQRAVLTAFDGTKLNAINIIGQYNPDAEKRLLLLAHWDCRPWADNDSNPSNHAKAVDGANDGASGVGVLLEIARNLNTKMPNFGIDILFVDAEDWGTDNNDESWALGTRYFVENKFKPGYKPTQAILLDMVGGKGAVFYKEYFSYDNAPYLVNEFWDIASRSGFGDKFIAEPGGAVTDDHVVLLQAGIPAIDIIEFNPQTGFNASWHTTNDNMQGIDSTSLHAVGQTLLNYIFSATI